MLDWIWIRQTSNSLELFFHREQLHWFCLQYVKRVIYWVWIKQIPVAIFFMPNSKVHFQIIIIKSMKSKARRRFMLSMFLEMLNFELNFELQHSKRWIIILFFYLFFYWLTFSCTLVSNNNSDVKIRLTTNDNFVGSPGEQGMEMRPERTW